MDNIRLRTMTKLSKIEYGKNAGLTVGEIMRKSKLDLIYIYFNYGALSFIPEILEELKIRPEDYIEKPGKAPEKYDFYRERNHFISAKIEATYAQKKKLVKDENEVKMVANSILKRKAKKRATAKFAQFKTRDSVYFSKGAMQYRNHR